MYSNTDVLGMISMEATEWKLQDYAQVPGMRKLSSPLTSVARWAFLGFRVFYPHFLSRPQKLLAAVMAPN